MDFLVSIYARYGDTIVLKNYVEDFWQMRKKV